MYCGREVRICEAAVSWERTATGLLERSALSLLLLLAVISLWLAMAVLALVVEEEETEEALSDSPAAGVGEGVEMGT